MRGRFRSVQRCCAGLSALALFGVGAAFAGEEAPDYEVTIALGVETNSVFRGTTSDKPVPSVYAVLEAERGDFFAGLYASPTYIQDEWTSLLVGYWGYAPHAIGVDWIVGGQYYAFPGTSDFVFDLDNDGTPEKIGRKSFLEGFVVAEKEVGPVALSASFNFSPDVFGETGKAYYLLGAAEVPLAEGFELHGHIGHSAFEDDLYNDDYTDYAVGIYRTFFGLDMFLRYSNTQGLYGAENEIVVFGVEKAWTPASSGLDYKRRMHRKIRNDLRLDKSRLFGAGF